MKTIEMKNMKNEDFEFNFKKFKHFLTEKILNEELVECSNDRTIRIYLAVLGEGTLEKIIATANECNFMFLIAEPIVTFVQEIPTQFSVRAYICVKFKHREEDE